MGREIVATWNDTEKAYEIEWGDVPWGSKQHQEYLRRKDLLPVFEVKLEISHYNTNDKFRLYVREYPGTSQIYPYSNTIVTGSHTYYNAYVRGNDEIITGIKLIRDRLRDNLNQSQFINKSEMKSFMYRCDIYIAAFLKDFDPLSVPAPHYNR